MSAVDSETVFKARVLELGLEKVYDKLKAKGWCTYGSMAFCVSAFKEIDDNLFNEKVLKVILGDPEDELAPGIRRLYFESYTAAAADMERLANPSAKPAAPYTPRTGRWGGSGWSKR